MSVVHYTAWCPFNLTLALKDNPSFNEHFRFTVNPRYNEWFERPLYRSIEIRCIENTC
jgi:hypothetical protein